MTQYTITITEQISFIEREIQTNERKSPQWIANEKISKQDAERRIETLKSILKTLRIHRR
jgi:hypothetical protein